MKKVSFLPVASSVCLAFAICNAAAGPAPLPSPDSILKTTRTTGGLVVHLGCGDGSRTAGFLANDSFRVQGLDADWSNVGKARERVLAKGLYERATIDKLTGERLPYVDNLVNLLIAEKPGPISREEMLRVIAPDGSLFIREGDGWKTVSKPRPLEMDEWTHFLHGPDNNPVAHDSLVGPPDTIQWMAGPKFSRAHEQQASFSSAVTSGGRMFYILDETPRVDIRLPSKWVLVARDAFNGVLLWKRDMGNWVDQYRRFRSGPANLPFRLVAAADKVFATLDFEGPVHALDAATGKDIRVIAGSEKTKQILYREGFLTLLADEEVGQMDKIDAARRRGEFMPHHCRLMNVYADDGKTAWKNDIDELVFPCVALKNGLLFGQTPGRVFAIDYETGKQKWSSEFKVELPIQPGKIATGEMQWEEPTLVVGKDAVYVADFKKVLAYSIEDGKPLWQGSSSNGYNSPADLFLIDNLVWMSGKGKRNGLDPATGEAKTAIPNYKGYMHPRCYRNKATDQFIMLGDPGVQIIDIKTGEIWDNHWIRGTCQYGVMPANGLLYVPPDSCACNMKTKLNGLFALASSARARSGKPKPQAGPVLEKGPIFQAFRKAQRDAEPAAKDDWPTFRGSVGRNGMTSASLPAEPATAWRTEVGGKLSAMVVADGRLFVAATERHTIHALDANSGKELWHYTVGGRVDSPPTVHGDGVYFGSADGWVYALRASDGKLAWRFRAGPEERRGILSRWKAFPKSSIFLATCSPFSIAIASPATAPTGWRGASI